MSFGEESTRTDQPNFPPQRFLTKAIRTARMSRQRLTKWWVGLKMDLKKIWPDISSVNTLPPKSQCDVLDLSVLCPACVRLLIFSTCSTIALMGARELSKILYFQRPGDQLRSSVQYQLFFFNTAHHAYIYIRLTIKVNRYGRRYATTLFLSFVQA